MKKLAGWHFFGACFILAFVLALVSEPAQAYVYDDFSGSGINSDLWLDRGPDSGLFSQSGDGYLLFNDPTGFRSDNLRSKFNFNMPFFVSVDYSDYQTANYSSDYIFDGSGPVLRIGYATNFVSVYEYRNATAQGFWAVSYDDGRSVPKQHLPYVDSLGEDFSYPLRKLIAGHWVGYNGWGTEEHQSGRLGIGYDGTTVSLYFDVGLGEGWQLFTTYNPGFDSDPYFFIQGYNLYGESLSFKVDQVQFNPVPLPAGALLLGAGLLRLISYRKKCLA
jgi:hypothetical protein